MPFLTARAGRRRAALAVPVVLALTLAACGGDETAGPGTPGGTEGPTPTVAADGQGMTGDAAAAPGASGAGDAAAAPGAGGSAAPVPTVGSVTGRDLAARITAAARQKGTVRFETRSTGGQVSSASGGVRGTGVSSEVTMTGRVPSGKVDVVKRGRDIYIKTPQVSPQTAEGAKPWTKIGMTDDPVPYPQVVAVLLDGADVAELAGRIAGLSSLKAAGREKLGGVQVTRYTATPGAKEGLAFMPPAYRGFGTDAVKGAKVSVSVWMDDSGLLHKSATEFSASGVPATKTVVTYTGWGSSVTVSVPPASQVMTVDGGTP